MFASGLPDQLIEFLFVRASNPGGGLRSYQARRVHAFQDRASVARIIVMGITQSKG